MFSFHDACQGLKAKLQFANSQSNVTGVSIDTRSLKPGDLFVALKGTQQDGHVYLEEAFRKGASGALIQSEVYQASPERFLDSSTPFTPFQNLMLVDDPEEALAELAAWYRSQFDLTAIGITGSVGKTSTKEFLSYLLGQHYQVLSNQGNFNNHLGLPLTLLRIQEKDEFCVAELGASHSGEIRHLARLLKPELGIITQVAPAHLEGFGSLEAIYEAKLELLESLRSGSYAIVPDDNPVLILKAQRLNTKLITVGLTPQADYQVSDIKVQNSLVSFWVNRKWRFSFPSIATFLAPNAAMAVATLELLGIPLRDIPDVWEDLRLPSGRFELQKIREDIEVIYDGYNASPAAFDKALDSFEAFAVRGRKILVFADMLELGSEGEKYHEALGRKIARCHFDYVFAYGERTPRSIEALHRERADLAAEHFEDRGDLAQRLNALLLPGDCVLFKASRGMKVEEVIKQVSCAHESAAPL